MYSTELIRKFPAEPVKPILYVVYNTQHIEDAVFYICTIHGTDYFDTHVTVTTIDTPFTKDRDYDVYIDPMVFAYKNSWND